MARKNAAAAPATTAVNEDAVAEAQAANAERATHLMVIDQRFGEVAEYQRDRVVSETQFFMKQGAQAIIEAGKRLVLLKEHEGHGGFGIALEEIGIAPRAAQKFMLVAAKFSNAPTLAHLDQTKLIELAVLDDSEIDSLAKGESVGTMDFDEIDRMSVRELRAKLKEMQEETTANEELLEAKTKKIDQLDRKLRKVPDMPPWSEESAGLSDEIAKIVKEVAPKLGALNDRIEQLGAMMAERAPTEDEGKVTALAVINQVHILVNLLAPAQLKMYDEFQAYVPVVHTNLYTPKG